MGKLGPGKSGSERKAKWPRKQGHKPRTSELFLGRRSGAERGQAELHNLKWKGKVGLVGLSALQARGAGKLAEGKGLLEKKEKRDFFARG